MWVKLTTSKRIRIISCMIMILICMQFAGCGTDKLSDKKVKDIDYTVVAEDEIPEILKNAIEEKKKEPFKLSYTDNEELYIVVGYGEQMSGGFSIVVDELYLSDNAIVFGTTLKGPEGETEIKETPTYPYMVVKMEKIDYEIIYE